MSADAKIREAVRLAGGAIPFERFMQLALYGTGGFYETGGRAGRRGDFLTSPEVGPLFGTVVARYLDVVWDRVGRPDPFTVVDAGAGPGTLSRAVFAAAPACSGAMRYVAVEVSAEQRGQHPAGVDSRSDLPAESFDGVILANELLDNLPFRLCVNDGGWREAYVAVGSDGGFLEVLSAPFDPLPPQLPADAPHGARAPLVDAAVAWLDNARSLVRSGAVLAFDYARPMTAELASRPWRDWLRTYRRHDRGGHYLDRPGSQDITTELPLDQFRPPDRKETQAAFLRRHGIDELVEEGDRAWDAAATRPDVAALTMRSRRREAEALTDPAGLGAFAVVEW